MDRHLLLTLAICAVIILAGGIASHNSMTDKEDAMREYLIINTKTASAGVEVDDIKALSGTIGDLDLTEYQVLKALMEREKDAVPIARFVYLLGMNTNGSYFFYVDSEPSGSSDYSPPGQVFDTESEWIDEAFNGSSVTGGPITDEWGTWMSGLVPITDPDTGDIIAVLGMDIAANDWTRQKMNAGIPSLMIAIGAVIVTVTFHLFQKRKRDENVRLIRSSEALRESSEKHRTLIENSHDTIFIVQDGKAVFVSPSLERISGFSPKDVQDKDASSFISHDDLVRVREDVGKLKIGVGSIEIERVHLRCKDPQRQAVGLLTMSKIVYHGKEAYMGTIHDITDKENAEAALKEANRKLQLMTGITRHDILNQLTVMRGRLELARMAKDPETARTWEGKAKEAADNIENMIAFTKEYQEIGMNAPTWQDLSTIVRMAANGNADLDLKAELPKAEVLADPLIVKVFHNLIDNAIRHGGATHMEISASEENGYLVVIVEDDGTGIEEKDRERLFDRGYGKHSGMGLFFSREVLQITGISIDERSCPGKGAKFVILVPPGKWRWIA